MQSRNPSEEKPACCSGIRFTNAKRNEIAVKSSAKPARAESPLGINRKMNTPLATLAIGPATMNMASLRGSNEPPLGNMPACPLMIVHQFQFQEILL